MSSASVFASSCVNRFAVAHCKERARLEDEYLAARDRLRNLSRLRMLSRQEERKLADAVAMAIANIKEHVAAHGCE